MFCHDCGSKQQVGAQFCSKCGTKLVNPTSSQEEASTNEALQTSSNKEKSLPYYWFLPIISFIFIVFGLVGYSVYEIVINHKVANQIEMADMLITEGDYQNALKQINLASQARPNHELILQLKTFVEEIVPYETALVEIDQLLQTNELDRAENELNAIRTKFENNTNPIYEPLKEQVKKRESTLTIAKVKNEINELTTLDTLIERLNQLSSIDNEETNEIKQQIKNKIVTVAYEQANNYLANHNFSNATQIIEQALTYVPNDEKLLSFKEKIANEKLAFEQAELQRIEQAMVSAAEEKIRNHTAAVEVLSVNSSLDEFGDVLVEGEIKNVATTSIHSVEIYYSIYDINGYYLGDTSTTVYPYYLEPGESGYFHEWLYSLYEDVIIEIDDITWYLY